MNDTPEKNILSFEQKGKDIKTMHTITDKTEQVLDKLKLFLSQDESVPVGQPEEELQKMELIKDLIDTSLLDIQNAHDSRKLFTHWKDQYQKIINFIDQVPQHGNQLRDQLIRYEYLTFDGLDSFFTSFNEERDSELTVEQTVEKQEQAVERFNKSIDHELNEYIKNKNLYVENPQQHLSTRLAIPCLSLFLDFDDASDTNKNLVHFLLLHKINDVINDLPTEFTQQLNMIINKVAEVYTKSKEL